MRNRIFFIYFLESEKVKSSKIPNIVQFSNFLF
jgi:hypothetical protein